LAKRKQLTFNERCPRLPSSHTAHAKTQVGKNHQHDIIRLKTTRGPPNPLKRTQSWNLGSNKDSVQRIGSRRHPLNAVCPGWTRTKRVEELAKAQAKTSGKTYEEIIKNWENQIPLKRLAQPSEIASLVVFLVSERASYITGAVFQVDGGYSKGLF